VSQHPLFVDCHCPGFAGGQSPQSLLPFVIIDAFSMGACSLLSHNYRRTKA
jgi:hypothetical protein